MGSHYPELGIGFVAGVWVMTLLATVCVCLRLYSRFILTRSAGSDDFLITVALVRELDCHVLHIRLLTFL